MATAVTMPQMGESVVEGTVTRWHKAIGDTVEKLEPLIEIATDKIDTDVPAPASGTLIAIHVHAGKTVEAGRVLGYIGQAGEEVPAGRGPAAASPTAESDAVITTDQSVDTPVADETRPGGSRFISPVVARLAAEHDLDLTQVGGTGLGGRVTKKDVLAFLDQRPAGTAAAQSMQTAAEGEESVLQPLTTMRRAIATHMTASKRTSPHVTTVLEADMTAVVRHRERHRHTSAAGVPLTYTAYFVVAAAAALRVEPVFNSRFTDKGILEYRHIHVGVAVALDNGLVVPVIRNADELNLTGVARTLADLGKRARSKAVTPDELAGGTFTLTNHGTGGSLIATPIINQPQAAILGVGAIVKRPVVRSASPSLLPSADDAIVIRPMCYLSLTFDHRLADGARADRFLAVIRKTLENWPNE